MNTARGHVSFAAGRRAKTHSAVGNAHDGAFAWSDFNDFDFYTNAPNEFAARATGGVRFVTAIDGAGSPTRTVRINPNAELEFGSQTRQMLNLWGPADYGIGIQSYTMYFRIDGTTPNNTSGGYSWFKGGSHSDTGNDPGPSGSEMMRLAGNGTLYVTGGAVAPLSDRASKQDFAAIDPAAVLDKVTRLPLSAWAYRMNPTARHIGPNAQDFRAAFDLGDDDKSIATVDADGVALAAIQGLNAKVEALRIEIDRLRREIGSLHALRDEMSSLKDALLRLTGVDLAASAR